MLSYKDPLHKHKKNKSESYNDNSLKEPYYFDKFQDRQLNLSEVKQIKTQKYQYSKCYQTERLEYNHQQQLFKTSRQELFGPKYISRLEFRGNKDKIVINPQKDKQKYYHTKNQSNIANIKINNFNPPEFINIRKTISFQPQKSQSSSYSPNKSSSSKRESIKRLQERVNKYLQLIDDISMSVQQLKTSRTACNSADQKDNSLNEYKYISNSQISPSKNIKYKNSKDLLPFTLSKNQIKKIKISDFLILKKVGSGRFGQLFQAIHKDTGIVVGLKKINKIAVIKNDLIQRVIQQIKIQNYINHSNVVKLYGYFDDKDNIYLILQYMEEGSLYRNMTQRNYHKKTVKLFSERQISHIQRDILKALQYLHSKDIIHRDIKPQNIVLSYGVCKICDFGWSAFNNKDNGRRNTSCGTFDYTPPQILNGENYDQSVDLWQLGVLAFQLFTGYLPFYHPNRKQTYSRIINFKNQLHFSRQVSKIGQNYIQGLLQKKSQNRICAKQMLLFPFILIYEDK